VLLAQSPPTWIPLTPVGDPPGNLPLTRQFASAVYDPNSNRVIVFGGCIGAINCYNLSPGPQLFNDVWVLTNANGFGGTPTWIQLEPTGSSPSARFLHTAVYDPTTNRMIIWGGDTWVLSGGGPNDVWVLLNANGLDKATGQPATPEWMQLVTYLYASGEGSSGVYDPLTNRMMVFGGWPVVHDSPFLPGCGFTNDVWVLANANGLGGGPQMIPLAPTSASGSLAPPRSFHSAAYDVSTNRMIVFGGNICPTGFSSDVWVLANANGLDRATGSPATPVWNQLVTTGDLPPARRFHASAYDPTLNRLIIFGGSALSPSGLGALNDVWVLTNANGTGAGPSTWIPVSPSGTPPSARDLSHNWNLFDPASGRMIVLWGKNSYSSDSPGTFFNDVWILPVGVLSFPLAGKSPDDSENAFKCDPANSGNDCVVAISSVMDHSVNLDANGYPLFYPKQSTPSNPPDDIVQAFTGEKGLAACRLPVCIEPMNRQGAILGYKNTAGTNFTVNGNYTGGSDCVDDCSSWLFYEGHPGYDYPAALGTPIYAPAAGTAFVPDCDPVTRANDCIGSNSIPKGSAVDGFNILAIDHGNGYSTWYLHLGDQTANPPTDFRVITCPGQLPLPLHRGDGQGISVTTDCTIGKTGNKGIKILNKRAVPITLPPHLHFEVRRGVKNFQCTRPTCVPVDPYGWSDTTSTDPYPARPNIRLWK